MDAWHLVVGHTNIPRLEPFSKDLFDFFRRVSYICRVWTETKNSILGTAMKPDHGFKTGNIISAALNAEFKKADWWGEVQDDVRARLLWVMNNIEQIGLSFYQTFITFVRWEFERRKVEGSGIKNPMTGYLTAILGMRISEEAYQCGRIPTRAVLDLYDYIEPNDADVTACMFLCHKIETLQHVGLLVANEEQYNATREELKDAFSQINNKNRIRSMPNPGPDLEHPDENINHEN